METVLWIVVLYLLFVRKAPGTSAGGGTAAGPASETALYGAYISNDDLNAYNSASPAVDGSWGDGLGFDIVNTTLNGSSSSQGNTYKIPAGQGTMIGAYGGLPKGLGGY